MPGQNVLNKHWHCCTGIVALALCPATIWAWKPAGAQLADSRLTIDGWRALALCPATIWAWNPAWAHLAESRLTIGGWNCRKAILGTVRTVRVVTTTRLFTSRRCLVTVKTRQRAPALCSAAIWAWNAAGAQLAGSRMTVGAWWLLELSMQHQFRRATAWARAKHKSHQENYRCKFLHHRVHAPLAAKCAGVPLDGLRDLR
eukprot:SAG11_NODE_3594_length_2349_cov_2.028000_2_plen_201_part_00